MNSPQNWENLLFSKEILQKIPRNLNYALIKRSKSYLGKTWFNWSHDGNNGKRTRKYDKTR